MSLQPPKTLNLGKKGQSNNFQGNCTNDSRHVHDILGSIPKNVGDSGLYSQFLLMISRAVCSSYCYHCWLQVESPQDTTISGKALPVCHGCISMGRRLLAHWGCVFPRMELPLVTHSSWRKFGSQKNWRKKHSFLGWKTILQVVPRWS